MPFMVHAALKAKSLNSCPGETDCRNAWHSKLRDIFQSFQNMQSFPAESAILSNVLREVINVHQDIWHFGFVLLSAVLGPKETASAFFMPTLFFPP